MVKKVLYPMISGGPDSFIALCIAIENYKDDIEEINPIFFNRMFEDKGHSAYEKEKDANNNIIDNISTKYSDINFNEIEEIDIPFSWYVKAKFNGQDEPRKDIYPHGRNLVFISVLASKIAVDFQLKNVLNKLEGIIITGFHADDRYDADSHFVKNINKTLVTALDQYDKCEISRGNGFIRVESPLIQLAYPKRTAYQWSLDNECDFILRESWSCYSKSDTPCEGCRGCLERAKEFKKIGIKDPSL